MPRLNSHLVSIVVREEILDARLDLTAYRVVFVINGTEIPTPVREPTAEDALRAWVIRTMAGVAPPR